MYDFRDSNIIAFLLFIVLFISARGLSLLVSMKSTHDSFGTVYAYLGCLYFSGFLFLLQPTNAAHAQWRARLPGLEAQLDRMKKIPPTVEGRWHVIRRAEQAIVQETQQWVDARRPHFLYTSLGFFFLEFALPLLFGMSVFF
jgi:hypothetical protein